MSEMARTNWREAVREDVWKCEAHGGLVQALEEMEAKYSVDPEGFALAFGRSNLEDPQVGPEIVEWWQGFFKNISTQPTLVRSSQEHSLVMGATKIGESEVEVAIEDICFEPPHIATGTGVAMVAGNRDLPIPLQVDNYPPIIRVEYVDTEGEQQKWSSYRGKFFSEAEELYKEHSEPTF